MAFELKKPISLSKLAHSLELKINENSDNNSLIFGVCQFSERVENYLTFSSSNERSSSLIIANNIEADIHSSNPRKDFIRALDFLTDRVGFTNSDQKSTISETAIIGKNVTIGSNCVIGDDVVIEDNTVIHDNVSVGKGTLIRSNSSIGGDGFGFERLEGDVPMRFAHLGGVVIGQNSEVGSCTAIAKGTLSDTIVGDNVKIDNCVHIAHNCAIGDNTYIIASASICGGVRIGRNCWIAPNTTIHQKVFIGDNVTTGLGSIILRDVESFSTVASLPARVISK